MKIPKMAEIVKRQMPAPRDIPQKIPVPRAKIRMQKPQSGGEFSVQIPGGARGGMVMAKIDNCIIMTVNRTSAISVKRELLPV